MILICSSKSIAQDYGGGTDNNKLQDFHVDDLKMREKNRSSSVNYL